MRGNDKQQEAMFSYVPMEQRVLREHPLRRVRAMADTALQVMSPRFDALYAPLGRPLIPPEREKRSQSGVPLIRKGGPEISKDKKIPRKTLRVEKNTFFPWLV